MNNIWRYLKGKGLTDYAIAGIMGNLYAESGLRSDILQVYYQQTLGMSSEQYTKAVDNGTYKNFVRDMAGYGLAQWTFWSRKEGLLNLAIQRMVSIGDLNLQLDYLWSELQEFGLVGKLNSCNSVREASDIILLDFEKPYDQSENVKKTRASFGEKFYAENHQNEPVVSQPVVNTDKKPYYCVELGVYKNRSDAESRLVSAHAAGFKDAVLLTVYGE